MSAPPPYGPPITLEAARRVMAAAEAEAAAQGWPMVIAIVDSTATLVMLHRLDQANLGAVEIAQQKALTAVRFRRSTKVYEDLLVAGPSGVRLLSIAPAVVTLEGGVPLIKDGAVVGAIGVSGMQSAQDGQVADAGARVVGV
jgi:glc operon protein GlcG